MRLIRQILLDLLPLFLVYVAWLKGTIKCSYLTLLSGDPVEYRQRTLIREGRKPSDESDCCKSEGGVDDVIWFSVAERYTKRTNLKNKD